MLDWQNNTVEEMLIFDDYREGLLLPADAVPASINQINKVQLEKAAGTEIKL